MIYGHTYVNNCMYNVQVESLSLSLSISLPPDTLAAFCPMSGLKVSLNAQSAPLAQLLSDFHDSLLS